MCNKRFQRILAVLLAFTVCLGGIGLVYAANNGETTDTEFSKKIEVLKLCGIVDKAVLPEDVSDSSVVTRAEFAKYLSRMLNLPENTSKTLYYYDVPKDYYAFDEITAVTESGYMKGSEDRMFEPEEPMKTEYIYKLFIKAIGGEPILKLKGGDSAARTMCADAEILDGVRFNGENVTLKSLLTMIYNTLLADCYGSDYSGGIAETDDSFLYVTRGMEYVKRGRVTTAGKVSLNGEDKEDDAVVIDGVEYKAAENIFADEYIGRQVEFIYEKVLRDDFEGTIIWMNAVSTDEVFELSVNPDCSFDEGSGVLTYYDSNDREKKITIPESIIMIYNGRFRDSGIKSVFASDRYELTLIKEDGAYKTAVVSQYENIVVDKLGTINSEVFGTDNTKLSLEPNDYDRLEVISPDNSVVDFSAVQIKDVLSVYKTADGEYCKVYITRNPLSGSLNFIGNKTVKIDDETLEFFKWDDSVKGYLGKSMTFYRDVKGLIAGYSFATESGENIGFLIKGSVDEGLSEKLTFKLLTNEGKVVVLKTGSKIKINGKSYRNNAKEALRALSGGNSKLTPQMAAYKLNSDNEITSIETASEDDGSEHSLTIDYRAVNEEGLKPDTNYRYYFPSAGRLGPHIVMTSATRVFQVPDDATIESGVSDKFFRVMKPTDLSEGEYEGAIGYRTTPKHEGYEEYVLVRVSSTSNRLKTVPVMFDSVYQKLDAEGNVVDSVDVYDMRGNLLELAIDSDFDFDAYGLKRGDLFRYGINDATEEITNVEVTFQPSSGIKKELGAFTSESRIFIGYVNDITDVSIKCGYDSGAACNENFNVTIMAYSNTAVIYDKEKDKIHIGKHSDLKPYSIYGDDCAEVILTTGWGKLGAIFAIQ